MPEVYELMHKSALCGFLAVDPDDDSLENYLPADQSGAQEAPFLGNADRKKMKRWWDA